MKFFDPINYYSSKIPFLEKTRSATNRHGLTLSSVLKFLLIILVAFPQLVLGQSNTASDPVPSVQPTSIATEDLAVSVETVTANVKETLINLANSDIIENTKQKLEVLVNRGKVDLNSVSTNSSNINFRENSGLEENLEDIKDELNNLHKDLSEELESSSATLRSLQGSLESWSKTAENFNSSGALKETNDKINTVVRLLKGTIDKLTIKINNIVIWQIRVREELGKINEALKKVSVGRSQRLNNLFLPNSEPIWNFRFYTGNEMLSHLTDMGVVQYNLSLLFLKKRAQTLLYIPLLFLLLSYTFKKYSLSFKSVEDEKARDIQATFLKNRFVTAGILSIFLFLIFSLQVPPLIWLIFIPLTAIAVILLNKSSNYIYSKQLLSEGVIFLILDQLRRGLQVDTTIERLFLIVEAVLALIFLKTFQKSETLSSLKANQNLNIVKIISFIMVALFSIIIISLVANIFGFANVSFLLSNAVFNFFNYSLVLYVLNKLVHILFGFLTSLARASRYSKNVSENHELVITRVTSFFAAISIIFGSFCLLQDLTLNFLSWELMDKALSLQVGYGELNFKLKNIVIFILTLLAAIYLSRLIRFILDEEVFVRTKLQHGLSEAISKLIHYAILLCGFLFAMAALGIDMTKFTILVSAFGVGLGFGLQNILNNFFSGLIVLLERPVRTGDLVQIGDLEGIVEKIGIRATFIRTKQGSELIVPNAKLISDQVINWTYLKRQRTLDLTVNVAPDVDPLKAMDTIIQTLKNLPSLIGAPSPEVFVTKLGSDSISLEIKASTNLYTEPNRVRSEINMAIYKALSSQNILIK